MVGEQGNHMRKPADSGEYERNGATGEAAGGPRARAEGSWRLEQRCYPAFHIRSSIRKRGAVRKCCGLLPYQLGYSHEGSGYVAGIANATCGLLVTGALHRRAPVSKQQPAPRQREQGVEQLQSRSEQSIPSPEVRSFVRQYGLQLSLGELVT